MNSRTFPQEKINPSGISIVICTYNGSLRLKTVIESLLAQDVADEFRWEIIVVDNASTDNTSKVAYELLASQDRISYRIVVEPKLGLMFARIKGIEESTYEIIGFVDDDNSVRSDWLRQAHGIMFSYLDVGVCGGMNEAIFDTVPPVWFKRFQASFGTGSQGKDDNVTWKNGYVFGAGMIVRKNAWNQARQVFSGFFPQCIGRQGTSLTVGEDNEICYAIRLLGWQIRYDSRLILRHFLSNQRLTTNYLFQHQKSYGRATVLLDAYVLAGNSDCPFVSAIKRSWIWQVILTSAKLLLFVLFFVCCIFPWFSEARLEARLRIARHWSRLKELFRLRKRYIQNLHDVQQRLRNMMIGKVDKPEKCFADSC